MHKTSLSFLFAVMGTVAGAQSCPERYRFVDFGMETLGGDIVRGGTVFRAFDQANTPLLNGEDTVCLPVRDLAKDGRSLQVPVVTEASVDTVIAGLEVSELAIKAVADVAAQAEDNARLHRRTLAQRDVIRTVGDTFICAGKADAQDVSCQIASPYQQSVPLVVYCDNAHCQMPVLGRDDQLIISAEWARNARNNEALGREITAKVDTLHVFLEGQFSGILR